MRLLRRNNMDGIILIDKEKNITSYDVVKKVSKLLNIKKVGHTGTLDPLATGLMVLCVNEGCKLSEMLTNHDKDYLVKVKVGIKTDTYDITGNILEENKDIKLDKKELNSVLKSFNKEYYQEVPIYSSVKINGKKLYQYAREGMIVTLPKRLVKVSNLKLIDFNKDSFSFSVTVSSGCYIRSLINDIGNVLNIPITMEELRRTRVGCYKIEEASSYDNMRILPITSLDIYQEELNDDLYKKVSNGCKIIKNIKKDMVLFTYQGKEVAIYQRDQNNLFKSYRVFKK